jgi:hypothetical protein
MGLGGRRGGMGGGGVVDVGRGWFVVTTANREQLLVRLLHNLLLLYDLLIVVRLLLVLIVSLVLVVGLILDLGLSLVLYLGLLLGLLFLLLGLLFLRRLRRCRLIVVNRFRMSV